MRSRLLGCLGLILLAIGVTGCGTSNGPSASSHGSSTAAGGVAATSSTPLPGPRDGDRDIDGRRSSRYDTDNDVIPTFGHAASATDRRAIAALLKRYYAVAAAGDGTKACSMLHALAAESVVEEHDLGRGPPSLRGKTCPQIASKVFAQRHRELAEDIAALQVAWVRVRDLRGLALVRFGVTRELLVAVHRDRGIWQMDVLLDSGFL